MEKNCARVIAFVSRFLHLSPFLHFVSLDSNALIYFFFFSFSSVWESTDSV